MYETHPCFLYTQNRKGALAVTFDSKSDSRRNSFARNTISVLKVGFGIHNKHNNKYTSCDSFLSLAGISFSFQT